MVCAKREKKTGIDRTDWDIPQPKSPMKKEYLQDLLKPPLEDISLLMEGRAQAPEA